MWPFKKKEIRLRDYPRTETRKSFYFNINSIDYVELLQRVQPSGIYSNVEWIAIIKIKNCEAFSVKLKDQSKFMDMLKSIDTLVQEGVLYNIKDYNFEENFGKVK